jgi:hypothetical protein
VAIPRLRHNLGNTSRQQTGPSGPEIAPDKMR